MAFNNLQRLDAIKQRNLIEQGLVTSLILGYRGRVTEKLKQYNAASSFPFSRTLDYIKNHIMLQFLYIYRERERERERNRERLTQPLSFSVFQYIDIYVGRERGWKRERERGWKRERERQRERGREIERD